ncbi:unnamed protein product [Camellia sinensis]
MPSSRCPNLLQIYVYIYIYIYLLYTSGVVVGCIELEMATSQCFENPPSLSSTCGSGNLQEIGGLKTYVTGPQDSKLAVLLISDVFGYEAPNLRLRLFIHMPNNVTQEMLITQVQQLKLANKVAAEGFLVVVPDFFYGEPFDLNNPNMDRESWRNAHGVDKGFEDSKPVISALRSKGVTSIGAAGFCWGGVVVVKLARTDEIQAAVVLHPGRITEDEIKEVKCPISILGAEIDQVSPPEQLKQFGEILSAKPGIDSFVKIFPGVSHGWSVRYDIGNESAVKSAEESHGDMLSWFKKYVK